MARLRQRWKEKQDKGAVCVRVFGVAAWDEWCARPGLTDLQVAGGLNRITQRAQNGIVWISKEKIIREKSVTNYRIKMRGGKENETVGRGVR